MKQVLLALRAQTLLFLDPQVPRVLQAQLVSACKVPGANKVSKVCGVKWVPRALKVPKVQTLLFPAPPAQQEQPVLRALKVPQVPQVFKVSRAQPVLPEHPACKVLQVQQVLTAPMGKTLIQSW